MSSIQNKPLSAAVSNQSNATLSVKCYSCTPLFELKFHKILLSYASFSFSIYVIIFLEFLTLTKLVPSPPDDLSRFRSVFVEEKIRVRRKKKNKL